MENIKQMRERHQREIEKLRNKCKHPDLSEWIEEWWAPGHSTGRQVRVCEFCEKIIEHK